MAELSRYRTTGAVTFGAGTVLGLSDAQAAARESALLPLGKGLFQTRQAVQFKAGEELRVEGGIPKALADDLDAVAKAPKPKAPADDKPLSDGA